MNRKEYQKQYRKDNKEHIDKLIKEWHKANPEKLKIYKRNYKEKLKKKKIGDILEPDKAYGYDL